MQMLKSSPWGKPDHQEEVAYGILRVDTPSHGGYKLDRTRNAEVDPSWRINGGWYEEDCDWAIVALTFPQFFPEDAVECADECARAWNPHGYMSVHPNVTLTPETSFTLFREREEAKLKKGLAEGKLFRRYATMLPNGMVEVVFNNHAHYSLQPSTALAERTMRMHAETYGVIATMSEATIEDYAKFGAVWEGEGNSNAEEK